MFEKLIMSLAKSTGFGGALYYALTNFDLKKIIETSNTPETAIAGGFLTVTVVVVAFYLISDTAQILGELITSIKDQIKKYAETHPRPMYYPPYWQGMSPGYQQPQQTQQPPQQPPQHPQQTPQPNIQYYSQQIPR